MNSKIKHILIICLLLVYMFINAQPTNNDTHTVNINIPEVALLNIHSTSDLDIKLSGTNVIDVGKAVIFNDSDTSTWINYSSVVGSKTKPVREITVQISEGNIPEGLVLYVKAYSDVSKGGGKVGKPIKNRKKLTNNPITIIKKIGSSYTGVGPNKGHNIEYSIELDDSSDSYSKLDFNQSGSLTVTYTLSDN